MKIFAGLKHSLLVAPASQAIESNILLTFLFSVPFLFFSKILAQNLSCVACAAREEQMFGQQVFLSVVTWFTF